MDRNTVITVVAVALAAFAWGARGEAQTPNQGPAQICTGFQVGGMNVFARTREDRESKLYWDIRAAELPPGWIPIGVVNEGAAQRVVWACRPAPVRPGWGEHRVIVRPG